MGSGFSCYSNLTPSASSTEPSNINFIYYVLTYTVPGSPFFWTGSRYWLSLSMAAPNGFYWRARSASTPYNNGVAATRPFAFQISSGMFPYNYSSSCWSPTWQVQQTNPNNCAIGNQPPNTRWWPDGQDLSFKLIGTKIQGHFVPTVYLPAVQR